MFHAGRLRLNHDQPTNGLKGPMCSPRPFQQLFCSCVRRVAVSVSRSSCDVQPTIQPVVPDSGSVVISPSTQVALGYDNAFQGPRELFLLCFGLEVILIH